MQFLLVTTQRPRWFLRWLAPAITVLLPLGLTQELPARLATATVILVLGLAIIGLIRSSAAASLRSGGLAQRLETLSISAGRGMRNPRGHQGQMTSPQAVGKTSTSTRRPSHPAHLLGRVARTRRRWRPGHLGPPVPAGGGRPRTTLSPPGLGHRLTASLVLVVAELEILDEPKVLK
jgi:hypothetical protein